MSNQPRTSSSSSGQSGPLIDIRPLPATYTNLFRASGSPEELILDFGLDPHRRSDDAPEAPAMFHRLVLTWNNARRLAAMLHELIQLHDKAHAPRNPIRPFNQSTPPPSTQGAT